MLLEDLNKLTQDREGVKFLAQPIHMQAKKDFQFLCGQTDYSYMNNVNFVSLRTANTANKYLGDFFVIGHELSDKIVKFPKEYIDLEKPNTFVSAVCYAKDKSVADVLVFPVASFKNTGLLSMFKNFDKTGEFGIAISSVDDKKVKQYSFGYVLKNLE